MVFHLQCLFPLKSLKHNSRFPKSGCSIKASSPQLLAYRSRCMLDISTWRSHSQLTLITSTEDFPSINTYIRHIHRRPSLSSCRFILFGGTVTQLDTLLRKHPHSLFLTVSIQWLLTPANLSPSYSPQLPPPFHTDPPQLSQQSSSNWSARPPVAWPANTTQLLKSSI